MVDPRIVRAQLKKIGADFRFWGYAEAKELPQILIEGETIQHALNGRYEGGFAMLCATDHRLLLVDKKPLFLGVDDIRYDMVTEVNYSHQLVDAMLHACTLNKTFHFRSFHKPQLRKLTNYVQQRILQLRQQYYTPEPAPAPSSAPAPVAAITTDPTAPPIAASQSFLEQSPLPGPLPVAATIAGAQSITGALARRAINPYAQVSLFTRRRISPFDFARK